MMREEKISTELKEYRKILKFSLQEMAFLLDEDIQIYRMYENKKFDKTYSIKKYRLKAKLILLPELFKDRIKKLIAARRVLVSLRRNGTENGHKAQESHSKNGSKFHPKKKNKKLIQTESVDKPA